MIASTCYSPLPVLEVSQVPSLLMLVSLGVAGDGASVMVVLPLGWQVPLLSRVFWVLGTVAVVEGWGDWVEQPG